MGIGTAQDPVVSGVIAQVQARQHVAVAAVGGALAHVGDIAVLIDIHLVAHCVEGGAFQAGTGNDAQLAEIHGRHGIGCQHVLAGHVILDQRSLQIARLFLRP